MLIEGENFAVVASETSNGLTAGAGQTEHWFYSVDGGDTEGAGSTEAGAATVSTSWALGTSDHWAIGGVSLRQTRMVKLELTLSSEEGGSVSMRTKVYMRNYQ